MGFWRRFAPKRLHTKLLLMCLVAVSIPIAITGYIVESEGRAAREEEKHTKLFGLAHILDAHLGGGFQTLLADYEGDPNDRAAKIAFLNQKLRDITDIVATSNPGVGVGYYSLELNAIITYGPSAQYGDTVGKSISPSHPGWKAMGTGEKLVQSGPQVRGQIMNAMWPIIRDGKVQGYIWSNELIDAIDRQSLAMDKAIVAVTVIGILLGALLAYATSAKLSRDVASIQTGLARLQFDLSHVIPERSGEIGEIVVAINAMAKTLLNVRSLNDNILSSIADGVIAVNVDGVVTSVNPAAERMLGIYATDIMGKPYQSLYTSSSGFASALLDTLSTGQEHINVIMEYPRPDQTLHISTSSSLLKDGNGQTIGAVGVMKDLSEQNRLHKQIMRADRLAALGELMAGVAHEIRNPLTSIRGFMQYLDTCDSLEEWKQYAPLIIRQVDSLNRIIGELLEFGRHRPPCLSQVRINELIREITMLVGRDSSSACIALTMALADDLPTVEADGEALKQVILNLVINALQAIPEHGTIVLSTQAFGPDFVEISVSDDGVGIPPENLEKIYDPFFSTKPTGTGLGLAMAHRIIDSHDGTISIVSIPNHGTTVTLRIPCRHKAPDAFFSVSTASKTEES